MLLYSKLYQQRRLHKKGLVFNKAGKRQLAMKIAKVVMEVTKEKLIILYGWTGNM
jgi:hypothetical protein